MEQVCFLLYIFLAFYAAGMMTTLQMQHFALYPKVGKEAFPAYIAANNKAAVLPSIVPALLLTLTTMILSVIRQTIVPSYLIWASLLCNCVNLISTGIWQGRLHGRLARSGYDEVLVAKLVGTNWIRTCALWVQAALAMYALSAHLG